MQTNMLSTETLSSSTSVSRSNVLSLYHFLWQQQDHSVVRRGLKCDVVDLEDYDQSACFFFIDLGMILRGLNRVHPFIFDVIDLSRHLGAKLPNGATSMLIRSEYKPLFKNISAIKRNFIVHGSAGIGKSTSFLKRRCFIQPIDFREDAFPSIRPRQATSRSSAGNIPN